MLSKVRLVNYNRLIYLMNGKYTKTLFNSHSLNNFIRAVIIEIGSFFVRQSKKVVVCNYLFFHLFINNFMTIGLIPVIGITLPLLSYGGSSLITFTVLIFIMLRLDADKQMVLR